MQVIFSFTSRCRCERTWSGRFLDVDCRFGHAYRGFGCISLLTVTCRGFEGCLGSMEVGRRRVHGAGCTSDQRLGHCDRTSIVVLVRQDLAFRFAALVVACAYKLIISSSAALMLSPGRPFLTTRRDLNISRCCLNDRPFNQTCNTGFAAGDPCLI